MILEYHERSGYKGVKMANILIPVAQGFEEIEAVALIDVLRRAELNVLVLGVGTQEVKGGHGITLKCDGVLGDISADELDMIVLPGGWGGTYILAADEKIQSLIKEMDKKGKEIGAICAAPFALDKAGVLKDIYTCYPSVEEKITHSGYHPELHVVEDQNVMTSRGPGTAICFGLAIVKKFKGETVYEKLKAGLLAENC